MSSKYDYLKEQYPETISINQFHKICRIAKRNAVYLLENGIIPYTDTGKMTWKYKIHLDDVISYLIRRDQEGGKIPRGAVPNRNKKRVPRGKPDSFGGHVQPDEIILIRQYFEQANPQCPDLLSSYQAAAITGLEVNTIRKKIRLGELRAIINNRTFYIPRDYLFEFLGSPSFLRAVSYTESFKGNLDSFIAWKEHQIAK